MVKKRFYENIHHESSTLEPINYESNYYKKKFNVLGINKGDLVKQSYMIQTITLPKIINDICKRPIDVLKLDIEGHEYSCLKCLFHHSRFFLEY